MFIKYYTNISVFFQMTYGNDCSNTNIITFDNFRIIAAAIHATDFKS